MLTAAGAGPGQGPESGTPSGATMWVVGVQLPEPSLADLSGSPPVMLEMLEALTQGITNLQL